MNSISIGDLSQVFQMRRHDVALQEKMGRLGRELTTGIRQDRSVAVSGDFVPLAGMEHQLRTLTSRKTTISETAALMQAAQLSLGEIQGLGRALTPTLLSSASTGNVTLVRNTSVDAGEKLASVMSVLNTRFADRAVFAGAGTDGRAVITAQDLIAQLNTVVAAQTTASGVAAALDSWFSTPGGGFETLAYLGAPDALGPLPLGDGESVSLTVKADNPELREVVKSLAMAAVISQGALSGDLTEQAKLVRISGERLIAADDKLTGLRASIGAGEARVDAAAVRNAAEGSALELARAKLIGVNQYETASELETVYSRVEALYTITSRLSRLNFTDYMR